MRHLFYNLRRKNALRGLTAEQFVTDATHFLAELNAIHPFRDGNGRTQLAFMTMLADSAGHPLNLVKLRSRKFLSAMIASFFGDEAQLETEIRRLTEAN